MTKLAKQLYRILRKSGKTLFLPDNKPFLLETISVFHKEIAALQNGKVLIDKLKRNPRDAVQNAFRDGKSTDIDALFVLLPRLAKYFRAGKLIDQFVASNHDKSNSLGKFDLGKGSLLISKLNYSDKELKLKDVDGLFEKTMQTMISELRKEVKQVVIDETNPILSTYSESLEQERRNGIFMLLMALDRLIKNREGRRTNGSGFAKLVDVALSSNELYMRATPIVYSSIYCSLINRLNLEYQAFGVVNPKDFLSKIVVKDNKEPIQGEVSSLGQIVCSVMAENAKSDRLSFSFVKELNVWSIPGRWMYRQERQFGGSFLTFDKATSTLSAFQSKSPEKLIWQLELTLNSRPTTSIKVGQDYIGDYFAHRNGAVEKTSCTIRFYALSPDLISESRNSFQSDDPFIEIEISFKETCTVLTDSESEVIQSLDKTDRFCRMSDVDWCLIDFSDRGVLPLTPILYLDYFRR
jgi:hypothetical protein